MSGTPSAGAAGGRGSADPSRVLRASATLLADALAGDDAEAGGLRADDVLADPDRAMAVLGGPDAWLAARYAVVQRYGRVGALLVLGYEERWRHRHSTGARSRRPRGDEAVARCLEGLLDGFAELDAVDMDELLAELDAAAGTPQGPDAEARRWLHATYAIAARDGTDAAHRAYMEALDRVLRLARSRLAS